jgi:three-Cys-motif partner protein
MAVESVLWPKGPHTEGKHLVLRAYLNAWLPILGRHNRRILFVDGFAGPGKYTGGEEGSPVIALRALIEHHAKGSIAAEVVYFFIEQDENRARHLEALVEALKDQLPKNATASVISGTFDAAMTQVLDALDAQGKQMAPALVMIDPFGIKGLPMKVVRRILATPRCEVYISFIYENMNRFLSTEEFAPHLDALFGTDQWRSALGLEGDHRRRFLYKLYADQLREAGANHVVHFDLYEEGRLVYAIFFGSQHELGCDRMKQAIWKVAPEGRFAFRGTRNPQLRLEVDEPDFEPLRKQLQDEFGPKGWVTIEEIQSFVQSDRCDYHVGQLKKNALKPLEKSGLIEVDEATRKNRWTFPPGCRLKIKGE